MNVYLLKVWAVVPGKPKYSYDPEGETSYFTTEDRALDFADWWKGDQGRWDTQVVEHTFECPVIDGIVYKPDVRIN